MATATDEIYVKIITDTQKSIASLAGLVKSVLGVSLSMVAFKKVLIDTFNAYKQEEDSIMRLNSALRITGQYSDKASAQLDSLAKRLQSTTVYADDTARAAEGILMQLGNLSVSGVQKIMPLIADFASSMGIDLVQASELVGKSIGGTTNMLGRYGIQIGDATDPNQRFAKIMEQLAGKFGGMAESIAKTTGGQLEMFKNQIDDLKEALGGLIAKLMNPVLAGLIQIGKFNDAMKLDPKTITDIGTLQMAFDELIRSENELKLGGAIKSQAFLEAEKKRYDTQARLIWDQIQLLKKLEKAKHEANVLPSKTGTPVRGFPETTGISGPMEQVYEIPETVLSSVDKFGYTWGKVYDAVAATAKAQKDLEIAVQDNLSLFQSMASVWSSMAQSLVEGDVAGAMVKLGQAALQALTNQALLAAASAAAVMNWPVMAFWLGVAGVSIFASAALGSSGNTQSGASSLPHMAGGGVVSRPTMALIGESGPEAVVPLGRGMGGTTIIVQGSIWAEKDLARALAGHMARW